MPSLIPEYEYDIFISYRHKDNKTGWVTEFVQHLKEELEATFKEDVSIYFDSNATDGLLENHNVDKSLEGKIKSLIFIPILSQTYCDVKSFAWQHEFVAFNYFSTHDQFGRDVKLRTGNVASRILPVRIHDLDMEDQKLLEDQLGSVLRPIDFIYKETGVVRPLLPADNEDRNQSKTKYLNQINKVAHALKDVIVAMQNPKTNEQQRPATSESVGRASTFASKKITVSVVAFVLLVSAVFGISTLFGEKTVDELTIDRSIAVLPFVDMSSAKDQEYFSDGLSEELLNLLAKVPDLKVISRTSAFSFKGKNEDIRAIADKLGVAYLLEGSVRKSDNKIRITAQLIKASDGSHLWSENYDREMVDIFKVQDEIADAVVDQLKIKLLGKTGIKPRESKPEVYNLSLQARFYGNLGTSEGERKALALLKEANALDSTDARILSQLALTYSTIAGSPYGDTHEIKRASALALPTAKKAISMDPNLADGYSTLGFIYMSEWEFEKAAESHLKAMELDPTSYKSIHTMAISDFVLGNFEKAERLFKQSVELAPTNSVGFYALGNVYAEYERFEDALDQYHKALALTPRDTYMVGVANVYLALGNAEKAMVESTRIEDEFWKQYSQIHCLWSLGQKNESNAQLADFEKKYADIGAMQVAELYAWRKEVDNAFNWLERAFETRDPGLSEIKTSLFFKPFRTDPRYKAILKKVGLPV